MPPNSYEISVQPETNTIYNEEKPSQQPVVTAIENGFGIKLFQAFTLQFANVLVGFIVGAVYLYAFRNELPLSSTPTHAVLCVTGYQLLMGQGILSMASENGWTTRLKVIHKRRFHLIMQIIGAAFAIAGTFVKILDSRSPHFQSWHGTCGLTALVFTTVSLVNGLSSLYAYELRGVLPGTLSKITHICFGTVAFIFASTSLCLGFDKTPFRNWSTAPLSSTLIGFVVIYTVIIITNPLINFSGKVRNVVKK